MTTNHRGYRKEPTMVARKIADEFILVPIRHQVGDLQCIYTLNPVAARVWELVDDPRTAEDIVGAIVAEYEVETPQARKDILEFLGQMEAIGALVPVSQEAAHSPASKQGS